MKNITKIILYILILMVIVLTLFWMYISGSFLQKADVYVGRVVWKGNDFFPISAQVACVKDKVIGRSKNSFNTFIYSVKGSETWKEKLLIVEYGDNPTDAWILDGYQIPRDGEITGIILKAYSGKKLIISDDKMIQRISEQKDDKNNEEKIVINEDDYYWCSVYLCYENCPIGLFGFNILNYNNEILICKDRITWDQNWIAENIQIPNSEDIPFLQDLIDISKQIH